MILKELSRNVFHCSVIKDRFSHCRLSQTALLLYHVAFCLSRTFFNFFSKLFLFLSCSNFDSLSHPTGCCQELFYFFFSALWSLWDLSDATLIGYHRIPDLSTSFFNFSNNLFIHVFYYVSDIFPYYLYRKKQTARTLPILPVSLFLL